MSKPFTPTTRTDAFAMRLKKRYAAERRFRLAGLSAVMLSVAVLIFLLVTMTINGIGGFQRAELAVTIDFPESGIVANADSMDSPTALQTLEIQGLPPVVNFYAEKTLGTAAAGELNEQAWREVGADSHRHPGLTQGKPYLHPP